MMKHRMTLVAGTAAATVSLLCAATAAGAATAGGRTAGSGSTTPAEVRVDQVGYPPDSVKVAYAMLPGPVRQVKFTVSGSHGVVFRGRSSRDAGSWNSAYRAVYRLDFTGLHRTGNYRITISVNGATAVSPVFAVTPAAALYHRLVLNGVRYFTSERDGANVRSTMLGRQPANLTDRNATVYADPRYDDGLLLLAARDFPGTYPTLAGEAGFGLRWLQKLWRPAKKVLYIQVGIGNGNASNTIQGDYNFWFLPQAEDRMNVKPGGHPGPTARYVKYRPVFEAAPPGHEISPEFAGRFAADFALGAQLSRRGNKHHARHLLALARGIFAMAKTRHVGAIVTTFPHDYYPGTEWKSAMVWGAAEIALADEALHAPAPRLRADLAVAAHWARAYIAQGHPAGGDTLNLYDNGALGEAELLQAMQEAHGTPVIAPHVLLADMAAQLRVGEHLAKGDPFGLGVTLGQGDASPHAFGLAVTNALYQHYGGSSAYRAFAQDQLNFVLGANGWGSSFVVGAGDTFPHCMQSEIANLAGSLTGKGDIQV